MNMDSIMEMVKKYWYILVIVLFYKPIMKMLGMSKPRKRRTMRRRMTMRRVMRRPMRSMKMASELAYLRGKISNVRR